MLCHQRKGGDVGANATSHSSSSGGINWFNKSANRGRPEIASNIAHSNLAKIVHGLWSTEIAASLKNMENQKRELARVQARTLGNKLKKWAQFLFD